MINHILFVGSVTREKSYSSRFHCDKPNSFSALKAVAKATSSGVLLIRAAIISTIAGKLQGSFRWKVQYLFGKLRKLKISRLRTEMEGPLDVCVGGTNLCKNNSERSVVAVLTCCGNFDALVFGYINGASLSTKSRSRGTRLLSSSLRTPVSDLSCKMWKWWGNELLIPIHRWLNSLCKDSRWSPSSTRDPGRSLLPLWCPWIHESRSAWHLEIYKNTKRFYESSRLEIAKTRWTRTSLIYPRHLRGQIVHGLEPVCVVAPRVAIAFRIWFSAHAVRRSLADSQGHTVQWQRIPVDWQSIHIPANSLALRQSISNHGDEYLQSIRLWMWRKSKLWIATHQQWNKWLPDTVVSIAAPLCSILQMCPAPSTFEYLQSDKKEKKTRK